MVLFLLIFAVVTAVTASYAFAVLATYKATCETFTIPLLAVTFSAPTSLVLEDIQKCRRLFLFNSRSSLFPLFYGLVEVTTFTTLASITGFPVSEAFAVHF